jgi:hypothetical protein
MQTENIDEAYLEDVLRRIREGVVEGICQEVERRIRLGLPLVVANDGDVEFICLDSADAAPPPNVCGTGPDDRMGG